MDEPSPLSPRLLFLDDAPDRAATFLTAHQGAVWVQTVEQCLELLEQPWDEVHLDHDLGGEVLVDHERADCGMAVVRWLCEEPHPHLRDTRFIIHTHNPNAACMMVLHLQVMGFQVQAIPSGDSERGDRAPSYKRPRDRQQIVDAHPVRAYAFPGLRPEKWPLRGSRVGAGSVRRFGAGRQSPSCKRPRDRQQIVDAHPAIRFPAISCAP